MFVCFWQEEIKRYSYEILMPQLGYDLKLVRYLTLGSLVIFCLNMYKIKITYKDKKHLIWESERVLTVVVKI